MATEVTPRLFSVDDYHRMAETGILDPAERIELLNGQIVEMSPIGKRHWELHARLVKYLNAAFPDDLMVVGQGSFPLGERSEPQPDIAIVRCLPDRPGYPLDPLSIVGVIEIADSSASIDLGTKMRLYASSAIPDYVVIDLRAGRTVQHSDPHELGYGTVHELARPDVFTLTSLPDVPLEATNFFSDPEPRSGAASVT